MNYPILVKNFDTNTRMSYNSITFLNPIKRLCKKKYVRNYFTNIDQ